jgi:ribokinase
MEKKILVIGSSNVDMIMKMEHLPKPGETVTDCSFIQVFGGKGANQAVGAARAGGLVTFVTCLGNDYNAFAMISNFKKDKINVDLRGPRGKLQADKGNDRSNHSPYGGGFPGYAAV